MVDTK